MDSDSAAGLIRRNHAYLMSTQIQSIMDRGKNSWQRQPPREVKETDVDDHQCWEICRDQGIFGDGEQNPEGSGYIQIAQGK